MCARATPRGRRERGSIWAKAGKSLRGEAEQQRRPQVEDAFAHKFPCTDAAPPTKGGRRPWGGRESALSLLFTAAPHCSWSHRPTESLAARGRSTQLIRNWRARKRGRERKVSTAKRKLYFGQSGREGPRQGQARPGKARGARWTVVTAAGPAQLLPIFPLERCSMHR